MECGGGCGIGWAVVVACGGGGNNGAACIPSSPPPHVIFILTPVSACVFLMFVPPCPISWPTPDFAAKRRMLAWSSGASDFISLWLGLGLEGKERVRKWVCGGLVRSGERGALG